MTCKGSLKDLGRAIVESPRLSKFRWTDKQLNWIEDTWPEIAAEVRRRELAMRKKERGRMADPHGEGKKSNS